MSELAYVLDAGIYGFYEECKRRHSAAVWKTFNEVFDCLPFSAVIEDKILCVHAGLSPELQHLDQVLSAPCPRPLPVWLAATGHTGHGAST